MIAIIGAGRMGEALLAGILHTGRDAAEVLISEAREDRAAELCQRYGVAAASPAEAAARADTLLLAVKPQDMVAALNEIAPALPPGRLVISVAAGITTAVLEKHLPAETAVVRAMPNTPALVGQGMTAIAAGTHTLEEHLDRAETLLRSVGEVVRVPEKHLDAVTALSGSGPAYFYLVAEAMIEAGVLLGLPRPTAERLVTQTAVGSAAMLRDSGDHPTLLREAVTSPGGTTAAALRELERHGLRSAFADAVEAACRRSAELAEG
ncbi:pyrroline-5-carboxylate reductase [Thermobifida fusca]|jgi:pyrroline-5-carboxylate reductase|uniref:Pyrroline-5-carboxylate reductase n=2 Tax=Thermobifida fusca TaxID=2021 RepID=A0A9P2WQ53_THEFU|nr:MULTISPECIES: pyrroline-5-carboxylate reductase [Thermobifida]AAZ56741.1 pyrroline-5-carboxylate reductase [Thermobifida fusca YX]EOR70173.1 pyrroline-5-carboxylate reductase [Thermobifida fusca TM51]MBO2528944.1 pyrroline-5-carboxylate reductase [Thermobifida sp.]MDD6791790.1 pyrroline-5-carboxylate reductase [Thermobifida fusca]PPS95277.1 pyrroline-5-carboxylate reductase [Thermobifida fusca]